MLNTDQIKQLFPILDGPLVYLDSAASSLTPEPVIQAMNRYYRGFRSNVHRGLYPESELATDLYEKTRVKVAEFIGAKDASEIIFTSGATAGLNLAARFFGQTLEPGDEILLTAYEHHSNVVPWQILSRELGVRIRLLRPPHGSHIISPEHVRDAITARTKVLAITHVSNVTGYTLPITDITSIAHKHGIRVVVDASQSVPHIPVNVEELNADTLVFSGHKMFGPTGVGVLWMKKEILEAVEPVFGGGGIVDTVDIDASTWQDIPQRFEPGTPPIAEVIGLGAAIDFINEGVGGMQALQEYNSELYSYAITAFNAIPEVTLLGVTDDLTQHHGSIAFNIAGVHPHDIASFLGERRIAVRAGHHCAQLLMRHLGVPAAARLSLQITNTTDDIDACAAALREAVHLFRYEGAENKAALATEAEPTE